MKGIIECAKTGKSTKDSPVLFKNGAMKNHWLVICVGDSTTAKLLLGQLISKYPIINQPGFHFNSSRYIKVYDIPLSSGMFHGYFDSSPGISC